MIRFRSLTTGSEVDLARASGSPSHLPATRLNVAPRRSDRLVRWSTSGVYLTPIAPDGLSASREHLEALGLGGGSVVLQLFGRGQIPDLAGT